MDNPTRWNITNSAQNIVSALVDPSKQFDHVFRREWSNSFSGFSRHKPSMRSKQDSELKSKLSDYFNKLEDRRQIKKFEAQREAIAREQNGNSRDKTHVPDFFMMEDFDLSVRSTFDKVVSSARQERSNYSQDHLDYNPHKASQTLTKRQLKELQQELTDYLDLIEERLASQISNRSGDFFQVMSSVDSVMGELSLAIKSVTSLRRKCSRLNENLIKPNMKSIHLSNTRNNAQLVLDKMNEIVGLCKVQPQIQLLLSTSDFTSALELIAKTRLRLNEEFAGVNCLKDLESQLADYERLIANMIQQEFVSLNKFHEKNKKCIESSLDSEQWKMVEEVPPDFQCLISMLVDEKLSIAETFSIDYEDLDSTPDEKHHSRTSSDTAALAVDHQGLVLQTNGSAQVGSGASDKAGYVNKQLSRHYNNHESGPKRLSYVKAGGSTYAIVNSVIFLVRTVLDYCKWAYEIRSLSAELLERLFSILHLFNSKTYQLAYKAGAIKVAGLKTMTTRSLVLSQRSLKLIILLIPAIHRHFSQLLPDDTNRLRRFDDIRQFYADHVAKIPERVDSIVKDVINTRFQEWEAKPPAPSEQFSAVALHLMRLHDNIQDVLPADELRSLFVKTHQTFKDVLLIHLRRLNISSEPGPRQWHVTAELAFYTSSLSKLSACRGWELDYDDLWTQLNSESDSNNSNQELEQQEQVQQHDQLQLEQAKQQQHQ